MLINQIRLRFSLGDDTPLDYVASYQTLDRIGMLACGFLNTKGGFILYGVSPVGGISGFTDPPSSSS